MPDLVDELLSRDDVIAAEPPDSAAIEATFSRVRSRIPELLLKLWRAAVRVQLDSIDAELVSLDTALEMAPVMGPEELAYCRC